MACSLYWPQRGYHVLHQRWIWGIHCTQVRKHVCEGIHPALKPRADITRSPKWVISQWPIEEGAPPASTLYSPRCSQFHAFLTKLYVGIPGGLATLIGESPGSAPVSGPTKGLMSSNFFSKIKTQQIWLNMSNNYMHRHAWLLKTVVRLSALG